MTVGRLIFLLLEKESNGISIIIAFILNLRALDHHSSFCRSAAFFTLYWWVLLSSSSLLGSIIIALFLPGQLFLLRMSTMFQV